MYGREIRIQVTGKNKRGLESHSLRQKEAPSSFIEGAFCFIGSCVDTCRCPMAEVE
jgi:hypothetical protein